MFYPIDFLNLTLAGPIGAAIGFERPWNQGMAGLRTDMLVARIGPEQGVYSARWCVPDLMGGAPAGVERFPAVP